MRKLVVQFSFLISVSVLLHGCFGPTTPQEVNKEFWDAVLTGNRSDVVEYSTLTDEKYYDQFSKDWNDFQPSFGKLIIDNGKASIDTKFSSPTNSNLENRRFTTYLVLHDEKWMVDYERTGQSINGGVLGELFSTLNQVGNKLSRKIQISVDSFSHEMERMSKELKQLAGEFEQKALQDMEKYAEQLRKNLKALEESINRALEEEENNLSNEDKHTLKVIAEDLRKDNEKLSSPSIKVVTDGSQKMGETLAQLETLKSNEFDKYKEEWRELSKQYGESIQKMMDDLSEQKNE